MKFRVTMKDPDGVYDSLTEAARVSMKQQAMPGGLMEREFQAVEELRREHFAEFAGQWLRHGEYIEVEFDTEAGTATVVPQ